MLLLDVTIVNVALPSIERDLRADFSDLQWVIDAYALTLAGLLLAAGSLADKVGRRRVFMLGLAIFTASSLACGLAPGPLFLLVYALIRGNEEGWGSALIVGCFAASALLLVLFVAVERRAADPLLDLSLFRKPAFTGATIVAFALGVSIFSMLLYITLFFQ